MRLARQIRPQASRIAIVRRQPGTVIFPPIADLLQWLSEGKRLVFLLPLLVPSATRVFLGEFAFGLRHTTCPAAAAERCLTILLDELQSPERNTRSIRVCGSGRDMISTNPFSWTYITSRWPTLQLRLHLRLSPPTVETYLPLQHPLRSSFQTLIVHGKRGE